MIVVVSAIVDPWVTTLSFVVALAMRIQAPKKTPFKVILNFFNIAFHVKPSLSVEKVVDYTFNLNVVDNFQSFLVFDMFVMSSFR